jgi:hypothetical protein
MISGWQLRVVNAMLASGDGPNYLASTPPPDASHMTALEQEILASLGGNRWVGWSWAESQAD